MTDVVKDSRDRAALKHRTSVLREFESWAKLDPTLWHKTQLLRENYENLLREFRARMKPDRDQLIGAAAAIASGIAPSSCAEQYDRIAVRSVRLARAITEEVDRCEP